MSRWIAIYVKEMLEMRRNAKWLWVPLVFVALGVMQPITAYYTPEIIKNMGGLPEGAVFELPIPSPEDVMVKTLSQFGTIGLLVLALAFMATVSGERQSGVAALILVKPVPHATYMTAKWAGVQTLLLAAFACGYGGAWYYTGVLFGPVDVSDALTAFAAYALWLVFVLTWPFLLGTRIRSSAGIAFATIAIAGLLSLAGNLFHRYMAWSPAELQRHASSWIASGHATGRPAFAAIIAVVAITLMLAVGSILLKRGDDGSV
ncbi:ABC transporter permease [Paenibacillus cymbidii]|uniref:ABC transporter permease n=1 Tax=Paenibacillus cymbidii TaxID=1639034 RepID=UPI00108057A4|nr:ABC transporter permease subunit [Paenibacillus cymbidii]